MLSSSPAVPLSSIDFADQHRRRLSLVTAEGRQIFTAHDGLPSPEHLTPISGTPGASEPSSLAPSREGSRRGSDMEFGLDGGASLRKVPSHAHEDDLVSISSALSICPRPPAIFPGLVSSGSDVLCGLGCVAELRTGSDQHTAHCTPALFPVGRWRRQ